MSRGSEQMSEYIPPRRPSGTTCHWCPKWPIGWTRHAGDWWGACIDHAETIPAWQKGDHRIHKDVVRGV